MQPTTAQSLGDSGRRRLPQPPADPRRDGGPDGRHVPRRARPEHRRHRAPPDHLRARRPRQALVGGDGLPARRHRLHAAVGQDLRPLRPRLLFQIAIVHVRHRVAGLGLLAEHRPADRLPRGPGPRRRRPDGPRAGHHRRRHPAPGARPLPGLLRRHLRHLVGPRPGPRRASSPTAPAGSGSSS